MRNHLKVRSACKRLNHAIDTNPDFFKGLQIPANEVIKQDTPIIRNVSIAGVLLAFFVKVFH